MPSPSDQMLVTFARLAGRRADTRLCYLDSGEWTMRYTPEDLRADCDASIRLLLGERYRWSVRRADERRAAFETIDDAVAFAMAEETT
jgi:hypothetical protein